MDLMASVQRILRCSPDKGKKRGVCLTSTLSQPPLFLPPHLCHVFWRMTREDRNWAKCPSPFYLSSLLGPTGPLFFLFDVSRTCNLATRAFIQYTYILHATHTTQTFVHLSFLPHVPSLLYSNEEVRPHLKKDYDRELTFTTRMTIGDGFEMEVCEERAEGLLYPWLPFYGPGSVLLCG